MSTHRDLYPGNATGAASHLEMASNWQRCYQVDKCPSRDWLVLQRHSCIPTRPRHVQLTAPLSLTLFSKKLKSFFRQDMGPQSPSHTKTEAARPHTQGQCIRAYAVLVCVLVCCSVMGTFKHLFGKFVEPIPTESK